MIETETANTEAQPRPAGYFTDSYVVRFLLQQTEAKDSQFVWLASEDGGYGATAGGLELHLESISWRSGPRLVLGIGDGQDRVEITEPQNVAWFGKQYATPEDAEIAQLLRFLFVAVRLQAARNEEEMEKRIPARKQRIYRRLLGADAT